MSEFDELQPDAFSHTDSERAITGIEALRGEGTPEAKGFWADAWSQVVRRPGAIMALVWIAIVAFLAIFAPILANGHPLILRTLDDSGKVVSTSSPLVRHLTAADWYLMITATLGLVWMLLPVCGRGRRLGIVVAGAVQGGATVIAVLGLKAIIGDQDMPAWIQHLGTAQGPLLVCALVALVIGALFLLIPTATRVWGRLGVVLVPAVIAVVASLAGWGVGLPTFPYQDEVLAGKAEAIYTIVPWSPSQRYGDRNTKTMPPGSTSAQALQLNLTYDLPQGRIPADRKDEMVERVRSLPLPQHTRLELGEAVASRFDESPPPTRAELRELTMKLLAGTGHAYVLGTDETGQDVLSQLIHASRLALSVGFVASSIAVLIGITLGALMGYFGGAVDLFLYRIVEVFMSIPVLVILIVAAGVLPRNTYVMMAIIGCFTWQRSARFTRAEFFKLRNQDFVQSAQAMGLPLRSILFKHMLPNGVTPVLVDVSFLIAAAILFEAFISFLGLGPPDQPSWGKLLADATSETGSFAWWLAIFPGLAIFLTVLAYNLIGEALRDAIDPKLKKARV